MVIVEHANDELAERGKTRSGNGWEDNVGVDNFGCNECMGLPTLPSRTMRFQLGFRRLEDSVRSKLRFG